MPLAMASYHYGHYGMSKAELRKSNKPIMEKRRRARINTCLNELKSLILDATNKDPARHSKLEKADILEMTVKHLQEIQREQMTSAVSADPSVLTKFHSGFTECATEVSRYVSKLEGVDTGVKRRLMGHLNGCVSGLSQVLPLAANHSASSDEDVNNNNNTAQRILSGLQLVPSRLPSGELAILLPSLDQRQQLHHGGSAFKTVVSQRQMSSTPPPPPLSLHPQPPPSPPHHQLHSSPLSPATSSTLAGDDLASEHQVTSTSPEIIVPIPQHPSTTAAAVGFARTTPPPLDLKIEPSNDEPSTSRGDMWRPW